LGDGSAILLSEPLLKSGLELGSGQGPLFSYVLFPCTLQSAISNRTFCTLAKEKLKVPNAIKVITDKTIPIKNSFSPFPIGFYKAE
jgi:hypothetical protein